MLFGPLRRFRVALLPAWRRPAQTARLWPALLLAVCLVLAPALAQTPNNAAARVDSAKASLDQIEATLLRPDLGDGTLQQLRQDIDPIAAQLTAVIAEIAPRIEAAKARLAQLGPKPGPKDPPEPEDVSSERAAQDKLYSDLDATAKRAKVLAIQAAQTSDTIVARRRAIFTHALFARSTSLVSPSLWIPFVREIPSDLKAMSTLGQDWVNAAMSRLSVWQRVSFFALLGAIALAYWPAWRLAQTVRGRAEPAAPSRLRKAAAALRVAVATAAVPIAAVLAAGLVFDGFDLPNQFQGIGRAMTIGVALVAVATGLARGFLAPKSPNWRLPPITDEAAKRLYHITITVTVMVAVSKMGDALNDVIGAPVTTLVTTRGLAGLAIALSVLASLRRPEHAGKDAPKNPQIEHWRAILRLIGWATVIVLVGAVLVGYVAFASFLVEQLVAVAGTLVLLYLLLVIADEGIMAVFAGGTPLGRALVVTAGFKSDTLDQLAILLSGLSRVTLYVVSILMVLAPWRIESGDLLATVRAAFFGFAIGDVTISLVSIFAAALLFGLAILATRALQRWLEVRLLPHTRLDTGLQNSIKTSLGYLGVLAGLSLALAHLGLSFERLAIVAGALSVGIGFGLQSIVNNFVSGLILLWERAIRVGDWITVGDEQGYVRRINVRSTEIETFDRALVIMPNSSLVTGIVKNWVRNDRVGRVKLPFTLPVTADPEEIRKILIGTAKAHSLVLSIPTPQVFFTGLTDVAMRFDLVCFIEDVESAVRVTSDLLFEIYAKFKEAGLVAPPVPPVVTSPALDKLDAWLSTKAAADPMPRRATGT